MDFSEIKELDKEFVLNSYGRYDLALVKGEGSYVWDIAGNKYLDMIAGIASVPLGHCHPAQVDAITKQAKELIHVSNLFYIPIQDELAKEMAMLSPMVETKCFFCNSGAESNEAAIKVARKFTKKTDIVTMSNSFHGRTMGSLSITDKKKIQDPFRPLIPNTKVAVYGDLESLQGSITSNTAAVFVEPIQGEGGIIFPRENLEESRKYFSEVRKICNENDVVMVADEVQSGNGRTGTYFACEQMGFTPDIISTAKGVANGFPMGVTLITGKCAEEIDPGDHGSTFGGNPLACASALATVRTIKKEGLAKRAGELGEYFRRELGFNDARGLGLMIGVPAKDADSAKRIMEDMRREDYILVNVTGENIIRMVPALTIAKEDLKTAGDSLKARL